MIALIFSGQSGDPLEPEVSALVIVAELTLTMETPVLSLELDTIDG